MPHISPARQSMWTAGCLCRESAVPANERPGRTDALLVGRKTRRAEDSAAVWFIRAGFEGCPARGSPFFAFRTAIQRSYRASYLNGPNYTVRLKTGTDSRCSEQRHRRAEFFALPIVAVARSPNRSSFSPSLTASLSASESALEVGVL
jgi:hypothetical protein